MNRHEHARLVQTVAEDYVIELLQDAGYDITVNPKFARQDITINGTLKVEIKGATWTQHQHSKGRYQFNIHPASDVLILVCFHSVPRFFVLPTRVVGTRTNIAIWSHYPSKYTGRWSEYCDNWNVIDQELDR